MYKVKIDHLESFKKALIESNKVIQESPYHSILCTSRNKAVEKNNKAIKLLDKQYLNIKP